jgi:hypothetical protein
MKKLSIFSILFVCLRCVAQDPAESLLLVRFAPTYEVGTWYNSRNPGSGTPADSYWQDYVLIRTSVSISAGGNAYRLRAYCNSGSGSVKMALYSGTTRLAVSGVVAVSASGWVECSITPTAVSAATYTVTLQDDAPNIAWDTDSASVTSTFSSVGAIFPSDPDDPLLTSEGNQNKHAVGVLVN